MQPTDETIAYCHACGTAMDVSLVAPFSNVECPACGKHTRVKREFGPYTLLRRHAIGGMSMVFAGQDSTLDREVAIKILSEDYSADERRIAAFEEEARITASISHPHVVRVLKTGKAFGRFYIAMEMVTGGHLEHQIKERGAIPEVEALSLAIQVAEGLRAAHSVGLIHRDIKPGNILLDSAGSAKIVDFGLALMTKGGVARPDELWATPFYVPPETVDGLEEDYRADVYAFGSTFYHLIAGFPPCTEESMVTTQLREAKKKVIPLSVACPHLTLETTIVMERAMAYEPASRYSSYEELLAALHSALLAASARAKGRPYRAAHPSAATMQQNAAQRRQMAKNRSIQRFAILATFLVVITACTWAVIKYRNRPQPQITNPAQEPAAVASPYEEENPKGMDTAASYASARSLLNLGDFAGSAAFFRRIFDDPNVQEPTRTLCGFESMLSDQLNGSNKSARQTANAISSHLGKGNAANLRGALQPALAQFRELKASTPDTSKVTDAISVLVIMNAALKNWESGMTDQALPLFKIVRDQKINDSTGLTDPYKLLAARYLEDAETLVKYRPTTLPDTEEECKTKALELNDVITKLNTRGRAKFVIREWQIQLKRREALLSDNPKDDQPEKNKAPFSSISDTIRRLDSQYDFLAAIDILKASTPATPQETAARASLIAMHECAASFLSDMTRSINSKPINLAISTKDGRSFQKVDSVSDSMVTLMTGETEASLPWSELSAATMISIYRETIRGKNASELSQKYEDAICFQWLTGDTTAAQTAAAKFSTVSKSFKERWQYWMKSLDK